ncbi:MAG: hypothetical protein U0163_18885 [Gemmatimonadaceae bacterium]
MINDILDFSKIEAQKLDIDVVNFDLQQLLDDALRALAPQAHGRELELAGQVAGGVPQFLLGDPARLQQVIVNLVGECNQVHAAGRSW